MIAVCRNLGLHSVGHAAHHKQILCHCDNSMVVHTKFQYLSNIKSMIVLMPSFPMLFMQHKVERQVQHNSGVNEEIASTLSRFQVAHLKELTPKPNVVITSAARFPYRSIPYACAGSCTSPIAVREPDSSPDPCSLSLVQIL